ncbi:MAG TPA: hypothetical protein VLD36_15935 [Burkholderiales bacterium]|nr:hypothetical protein [Burkholderiales bacterium]
MTSEGRSAPPPARMPREDHIELLLDQALEATFPASDPVALTPCVYSAVAMTTTPDTREDS